MEKYLILTALFINLLLAGCQERTPAYVAISSISKGGLARNPKEIRKINGQEIKVWGFVDHSNLYGNEEVKQILKDWWSGDGPNSSTWSFNLKAGEDDKNGYSFQIQVPNDPWRDNLLKTFLADARLRRPTKVYLKGKIFTFDMPTNLITYTGLYMKLESSKDILLQIED